MITLFIVLFILLVIGLALNFYNTPTSQKAINIILLIAVIVLVARLIGWL